MNDTLKIYGVNTPERMRLESAAMLINSSFIGNANNATARVEDVWFDYEGGVMWTTLMVGQYPALNPKQQKELTSGTLREWTNVVAAVTYAHRERINMLAEVRYGLQED